MSGQHDTRIGPKGSGPNEAIDQSIAEYRLGEKLRRLRLRKKISLVDLGKQTGLSPSMLSQLENGKLIPTLPTLTRIAMVFGVGLDFFFSGQDRGKQFFIVRAQERQPATGHLDVTNPNSFFQNLASPAPQTAWRAFVAEFPVAALHSGSHSHEEAEFLYVISGRLEIRTPIALHVLEVGDSCYFAGSEPHSYRCASPGKAVAIAITTHFPVDY